MRKRWSVKSCSVLIVLSLFYLGNFLFLSADSSKKPIVYIQPLGRALSTRAVLLVKTAIKELYGFSVKMLTRKALPAFAYYPPRRRYRAEKILNYLLRTIPQDAAFVLGLTAVDISTTKGQYPDWGIMGLATLDGKVCVISMYRCALGSRSRRHARQRLAKVAVHELGHNLGLDHCPTYGCLMEDARGTNKTIDREYTLCGACRKKIKKSGYSIPRNPRLPWPKPR